MKIVYTKAVTKDVHKLKNKKLIAKILVMLDGIKNASDIEELQFVKKMTGHPTAYRIRVGDYRMGIYYEDKTIILARFLKRNDIYKVFPK